MTKYDKLNPRTELEQVITADLKRALEKRGFEVKHNGTPIGHATGFKPDIEVSDDTYLICVEVTKLDKSAQDGEYQSIKDHMVQAQKASKKKTFCLFVSPETYHRTFSSIRDSNRVNAGKKDLKILPLSFTNFELLITKLIEHPKYEYTKDEILGLFNHIDEYIDDEAILRLLFKTLFSSDAELKQSIAVNEENKQQQTVQSLISDLLKLEDGLRKNGIATHTDAIKNVIYLVFMKLYEEKREITKQNPNRFSRLGFEEFQKNIGDKKKACHKLFELIKQDPDLVAAKMFNDHDLLSEKMSDNFVFDNFIVPFEEYFFYTTKLDGLGSAYEVLGQLSGKDTKAGQFFTPENIVRFLVMLADLKSDDVVLDFACGTARFLIYAMYDMIAKVSGGNTTIKEQHIKEKQLYGTDYDPYVAKLSKMNMYIHGDGKTNIQDKDGLLLYNMDGQIDAILTNPPLGNLDYRLEAYDENFLLKRMSVIPKKNVTQEKIDALELKLKLGTVESKRKSIEEKIKQLQIQRETNPVINVTGKEMKGGALFTNSAWHYLKDISNTDMPIEWRGGKLVVIVDEGILNTDEYSKFREFIKMHYYIKTVISLTSDTFVPVSKTLTKTSILFLIKKTDSDAVQREPIFFAYADKVGLNTKRKVCDNHLFADETITTVLGCYNRFRQTVLSCYTGISLNSAKLTSLLKIGKLITVKGQSHYYIRQFSKIENRFDENYNNPRYDEIDEIIKKAAATILLGDEKIIKSITSGKTPKGIIYLTGDKVEGISFLGAHQITSGSVNLNTGPKIPKEYHTGILKGSIIRKGRLLITMAGAVGRCSLYDYDEESNANQAVAIIELQENKGILPEYLKYYLNSKVGQLYFQKYQHASSQPNINLEEIKRINIIIPNPRQQETIIKESHKIENDVLLLEKDIEAKREQSKELIDTIIIGA